MMPWKIAGHALLAPLWLAASWTLAGCTRPPNPQLALKFQAAQKAFDQAKSPDDYLRVAGLYQEIRNAGVVSGALLYNQGNAFMRAGQRGRAIACYRQAKRYRPRDPYLDANLRYALGSDTLPGPNRSVLDYLLFWQNWISYPAKFHLVAAGGSLAFALGVAGLYFAPRRLFHRAAWATLLVTLVLLFSAAYDWYRFERIEHGVVIRQEVIARKGNAESYEPAFTQPLSEGTEFQVVERRGRWLLIRLPGAQEGWVTQTDVVTF